MKPARSLSFVTVVAPALLALAACYDPVHSDAVDALGPEVAGVPHGPTHRAGQPCTVCHGGDGPGSPEFSVAGTLYTTLGSKVPLAAGVVTITDARGQSRAVQSNEVGNFYVFKSEWSPMFPLHVSIEAEGVRREMITAIGRDGGCAVCHREGGDATHMPSVFLRDK